MEITEIAWVAGLLEGEGCFLVRKSGGYKGSIAISLQMSDEDTVRKCAGLLNGKVYGPHGPYGVSKKQTWQVVIFGSHAASWMMTLYYFMGQRRKEKIQELIARWRTQPSSLKKGYCINHPNVLAEAKMLCMSCYMKNYYITRKQNNACFAS